VSLSAINKSLPGAIKGLEPLIKMDKYFLFKLNLSAILLIAVEQEILL
jgi:hypothetical protein